MKYLIIYNDKTAFYTDYYDYENFYSDEIMCIINQLNDEISFDGKTWNPIEYDHL